MGLPRYEGLNALPDIALATQGNINYLINNSVQTGNITYLQEVFAYMVQQINIYQPLMLGAPMGYKYIEYYLIPPPTVYIP